MLWMDLMVGTGGIRWRISGVSGEAGRNGRLAQVEGTVIVKVLVGIDGTVQNAVSGQGAHPLLDRAALKAALGCRFQPGQQRELKVPTWVAVPHNFRLR